MPRMNPPQNLWQLIVLVVAVVAVVLLRMYGKHQPRSPMETPRTTERIPRPEGRWERLTGWTLADDSTNDGDSFMLRCGPETQTFRLYYADCPEKYRHQFNGERIAEQGAYFGGLTEAETIAAGVQAKEFAMQLLRKGPVVVETRWEPVYDSGRYFAYVSAGGQDLGEALVSRGLARIFTKGVERMDGRTNREQRNRLTQLEREAKAQRRGAWSAR
jgi:endonuclease YncB( thermonuclease family)